MPNWFSDITDCALKGVCADCKQPVVGGVGLYFSLFIPCTKKRGVVHVCSTGVHEDCSDTWRFEFEASGHAKLCDKHPFTLDIMNEHMKRELYTQCLQNQF